MFRDSYFRANLKSVTKRANEMADSLLEGSLRLLGWWRLEDGVRGLIKIDFKR